MEVAVFSIEGKKTGRTAELADSVFGLETPNDHAIYLDVKYIQRNRRQGTSKSKERSEVSGTNKKPFRQKGTGNARQGDRKSPLFPRSGGTIFGPRPRTYKSKLNKKVKSLARKSALTYKAREEGICVVENFSMEAPKTKEFLSIMNALELTSKKVLFVVEGDNKNIYLSGRNIPKKNVMNASDISTYDILLADTLVLTEDALKSINDKLAN
ncbi:MAG: 50S ribosomal protein L4 [Bacteroidota bacterium]